MAAPARDAGAAREPDAFDRLAAQDVPLPGRQRPDGVHSLTRIIQLVELELGSHWYWCPERWPTADGYAPLRECWHAWDAMMRRRQLDRLNLLHAVRIGRFASAHDYATIVDELVHGALG